MEKENLGKNPKGEKGRTHHGRYVGKQLPVSKPRIKVLSGTVRGVTNQSVIVRKSNPCLMSSGGGGFPKSRGGNGSGRKDLLPQ